MRKCRGNLIIRWGRIHWLLLEEKVKRSMQTLEKVQRSMQTLEKVKRSMQTLEK